MTSHLVDGLLARPALVFGSPPPHGRDLDLLLDADEVARVRAALVDQGWTARGRTVAHFGAGTAYAVDLVDLHSWAPGPEVARALCDESLPLEGHTHLRVLADHHRLLVLARRRREGMALDERKRATLEAFAPGTWEAARRDAPSWELGDAVDELARDLASGATGRPRPRTPRELRREVSRRRVRVIALSGVDGAGKSTHAEMLRTALEALGHDVSIQWTKIARDQWLKALVRPVRAVVNLLLRRRHTRTEVEVRDAHGETRNFPDGVPPPPDAAKLLRQRSRTVTELWALAVAFANATTHRREVRRRGTRVVICDRYVVDSIAHLRYRYGVERSFRLQGALVRLLSPRPAGAFLLDVQPETARARKAEQYTTADLATLRSCYLDAVERVSATVVDGEQPMEDVAAQLARAAWLALG